MTAITKQKKAELLQYAKEINALENEIQGIAKQVTDGLSTVACRIIECGQKLIQARLRCPPGEWSDWLKAHVSISERTVRRYISVASNRTRVSGASSLRQALALISDAETTEEGEAKQPETVVMPYLEALGRITRFVGYVERHPLTEWPDEGKAKAREDLEPVARELWPEKW
jgi:hypothetical protein